MSKLMVSPDLSLPLDFVTLTQAILARKRSGKSYTASVQAEELLEHKQQVVVVDPTSAWHGLRSSADGEGPGYPIVVFGGSHADAPLDFRTGKAMARAVVEIGFSAIFDIGDFLTEEQVQFVMDLSSELLRINRSPVHVFMDEADSFAPQKPLGLLQNRCLGTVSRLVKQGGIKGVGFSMITQRPASMNKDVLSQVDILTVLRMSHPLDIKAATDWIKSEVGVEFADEVRAALPSLPVGTAFFCSASLGLGKRVAVRQRRTFNSGATPKAGERKAEPKVLAKIDIEKLGAQISASVKRSQEESPEYLKAEIKALEKKQPAAIDPNPALLAQIEELRAERDGFASRYQKLASELTRLAASCESLTAQDVTRTLPAALPPLVAATSTVRATGRQPSAAKPSGKLRDGAERMLSALAQWYPHARTEAQWASQVGMKRTGGTWGTYKSDLRKAGYIEQTPRKQFAATAAGVAHLGNDAPPVPRTTQEVCAVWAPKLRFGAVQMLQALIDRRGNPMERSHLAAAVNIEPTGGTFGTYLSDLRSTGLIEVQGQQVWANKEALFL